MASVCACSFGCVDVWPCSLSGLGAGCPLGRGSVAAGGCAVRALCWAAARRGPGLAPRVPGAGVGRGARRLTAFIGRLRRRGFVGLGLGLCFAVVSVPAWCVPGGGRALVPWVPGAGVGRGARSVSLCVCV